MSSIWNAQESVNLTERQVTRLESYSTSDQQCDKTYARRIVEDNLLNNKWYNPNRDKEGLDLKKGWAFYEHFTLSRHSSTANSDKKYKHVDPGLEDKSELYSFLSTPSRAISEWGIGVALYFQSLKAFSFALFVACLISIPNIQFYGSKDYHNHQTSDVYGSSNIPYRFIGSAVCVNTQWVTCEESYCDTTQMEYNYIDYAISSVNTTFVRKSLCNVEGRAIISSYITIWSLIVFTLFFGWYQRKLAVCLDEDLITASDYSIHVKNPPPDATDPDEWRDFFMTYAKGPNPHVAGCTIVLNNDLLIWQLINRRICRNELRKLLPSTNINNTDAVKKDVALHIEKRNQQRFSFVGLLFSLTLKPILNLLNRFVPAEKLLEKIEMYSDKIRELQDEKYDVADVFITFETESDQRNALKTLNQGKLNIRSNESTGLMDETHQFKGQFLDIQEATEPSAVRYQDLSTTSWSKNIRILITFIITFGLIVGSSLLVNHTRKTHGVIRAGLLTTFLNVIIPRIVNLLLLLEKHSSEGELQRSLFFKVILFRWVVTVVMTKFLTDFTATLGKDERNALLPAVFGIFVAEITLVPVLRYVDVGGFLSKHYFAPRATTQDQIYLCFKGSPYNLAERYTDLTKIIFLSYYYCALYPFALLFGSVALIFRYYADKFCLLRTWRPAPYFGTQLADFSMKYFFSVAIVMAALASAFDFLYFSFDHVCDATEVQDEVSYNVNATVFRGGDNVGMRNIEVDGSSRARVCSDTECCQDNIVFRKLGLFKPWDNENDVFSWMSEDQESYAIIYAVTAFVFLMVYITIIFGERLKEFITFLFSGLYSSEGKDQQVDYSSMEGLNAYIPQHTMGRFPFPLLLCDVKDIKPGAIGWVDPSDETYRDHTCLFDIDEVNAELDENDCPYPPPSITGPLFSTVKHWDREYNTITTT